MAAPFDKKTRERLDEVGKHYQELIEAHDWENNDPPNVNAPALRAFIENKIPFMAEAMQRLDIRFVEKKDTPSIAWTDGFRIYVSVTHNELFGQAVIKAGGKWFASRDLAMIFYFLHEAGHVVLKSFDRRHERDPRLWNTATDEKINQLVAQMMKEAGMFKTAKAYENFIEVISSLFVYNPSSFSQHTAEEVFGDLHEINVSLGGSGGSGANGGDMVGSGRPDKDENGNEFTNEEKMARDMVQDALKDYMERNASKMPGSGTCGRELDYVLAPPKVRMADVLKKIPRAVYKTDLGYGTRPNRMDSRLARGPQGQQYRLPVDVPRNPDKIECICFVVDMSGSMTNKQLNDTINLIRDAQKYLQKVYLICHTDEVCFSDFIDDLDEVPSDISGGTAFKPVCNHLRFLEERGKNNKKFKFSGIVWITDGYGENIVPHDFYRDQLKRARWIIFGNDSMGSFDLPDSKYWLVEEI